jgi:copper homeostasis protein
VIAEKAGAHRIEFCSNYNLGGTTPSDTDISEIKKKVHIPVHVIIRPRGGNFIYTNEEIDQMKRSIQLCKQNNIDGIVFGILNFDHTINELQCKELIELAKPMKAVFHRAIDEVNNIEAGIKKLIALKFDAVLTSGGKGSALSGINKLKELQSAYGNKIQIIAGGGIRSSNIEQIRFFTACQFYHSAAIIDQSELANEQEIKKLLSQLS